MPERTGVRICLTYVSCRLYIRKRRRNQISATTRLTPGTEKGQINWISKGMSHSKVGQNIPEIFMNEIDADGDNPDQHFDGHAAESSTKSYGIEAMEVFKELV